MSTFLPVPGARVTWPGTVYGDGRAMQMGTIVRPAMKPFGPNEWIVRIDGTDRQMAVDGAVMQPSSAALRITLEDMLLDIEKHQKALDGTG